MHFAALLLAGLGLALIAFGASVLVAAIVINVRPDDAPMLSLLTGEPVDTGAPAPVYSIELARQRRNNTMGGAA
jgi:hypothetical protein